MIEIHSTLIPQTTIIKELISIDVKRGTAEQSQNTRNEIFSGAGTEAFCIQSAA